MKHDKKILEGKEREKEEFRWFLIFVSLIGAFTFFSLKMTNILAYADDVIVAEQPFNAEGDNHVNSMETFIIDLDDGGSYQSVERVAADIINDFPLVSEPSIVGPYFINESNVINTIYFDGTIKRIREGNSDADGSDISDDQAGSGESLNDIYVPDSDDDCPVSEAVPLPVELQEYLWTKCKKATSDYKNYYAFCLGVMEHESTFRSHATHYNKNGTTDRGIMQINSSNIGKMKRAGLIGSAEDLYNAYACIDCGVYMLDNYISMFGVTESAYYAYNTGRERQGSNSNSKKVMQYMQKWNTILFG